MDYSNRELDHMFNDITQILTRIEAQTIKTNGRVTRLEKLALIVGTAIAVLLVVNGSELVSLIKVLI